MPEGMLSKKIACMGIFFLGEEVSEDKGISGCFKGVAIILINSRNKFSLTVGQLNTMFRGSRPSAGAQRNL